MRYVIVENIWGVAGRIITWFTFEDSAEHYLKESDNNYEMIVLTKGELQNYIDNNYGYIE